MNYANGEKAIFRSKHSAKAWVENQFQPSEVASIWKNVIKTNRGGSGGTSGQDYLIPGNERSPDGGIERFKLWE